MGLFDSLKKKAKQFGLDEAVDALDAIDSVKKTLGDLKGDSGCHPKLSKTLVSTISPRLSSHFFPSRHKVRLRQKSIERVMKTCVAVSSKNASATCHPKLAAATCRFAAAKPRKQNEKKPSRHAAPRKRSARRPETNVVADSNRASHMN